MQQSNIIITKNNHISIFAPNNANIPSVSESGVAMISVVEISVELAVISLDVDNISSVGGVVGGKVFTLGCREGDILGFIDGEWVGMALVDGLVVGVFDGVSVIGESDGDIEGVVVGTIDGDTVCDVGIEVGEGVGDSVVTLQLCIWQFVMSAVLED